MKLLEELEKGWCAGGLKKFHYWKSNVSACKKHTFFEKPIVISIDMLREEDMCKECLRIYKIKTYEN